ncbi:hypothetical protein MTR67_002425 [Solanum verrucosum]|uniref:Integrase catalytic domain-containing protein n=1 Tax=Solanum verrucosum TaxID=315347 RepID=A0AAF0TDA4_SOLVR|nr:hypothetical protein MTR67_002425 [Solanum verrucosum]
MDIPIWKWEAINMDFITGLPFSFKRHDSIWVIIDRLTKSAHFLPVKSSSTAEEYAKIYVREVFRLHGTPLFIISDRGAQFTALFWRSFLKSLGTHVNLSTTFHPQTNGQAERTIQTLKYMLRAYVLDFKGETQILGPDLVHQAIEKVKLIKERLKMDQSQQKSYANVCRRDIEFQVDDWVFLKVSPMKGILRFGRKGKLSPRYIRPYKVIRRVGQVIPMEGMEFSENLSYEKVPVAILDRQVRKLRTKGVASVKVLDTDITCSSELKHPQYKVKLEPKRGVNVKGQGFGEVPRLPRKGSPSQATSQLVVKTTDRGKARGVALASWEACQVGEATGQGTTGTTMSRGALDGL